MSNNSDLFGRAYEHAYISSLKEVISRYKQCVIDQNSNFLIDKFRFDLMDEDTKSMMLVSSNASFDILFSLEPLIIDNSKDDEIELFIQNDSEGIKGDVRDIVIRRKIIDWEIGISLKHNHFAIKHSRLSKTSDFSNKWFGSPSSDSYWKSITTIFDFLTYLKNDKVKWNEINDKDTTIYVPILNAFMNEVIYQYKKDNSSLKRMITYLLGEYDFYKVISMDDVFKTRIQAFNINGTLNKTVNNKFVALPKVELPNKILNLDFKDNSKTTVILEMNNDWTLSFRIHNASTYVEASLKFDIQLEKMPSSILTFDAKWKK